jgi:hypothetical protein
MSTLDYPISILVAKGKEIAVAPVYDTLGMKEKSDKLYAVNAAVDILKAEKMKTGEKGFKREKDALGFK